MRAALVAAALLVAGCVPRQCRILSAQQVAVALRASDEAAAQYRSGRLSAAEAEALLEAHAADVKLAFPTYGECR